MLYMSIFRTKNEIFYCFHLLKCFISYRMNYYRNTIDLENAISLLLTKIIILLFSFYFRCIYRSALLYFQLYLIWKICQIFYFLFKFIYIYIFIFFFQINLCPLKISLAYRIIGSVWCAIGPNQRIQLKQIINYSLDCLVELVAGKLLLIFSYQLWFIINIWFLRNVYACPSKITDVEENYCYWDVSTKPIYRQLYEYYFFTITGENVLGNSTSSFRFHHYANGIYIYILLKYYEIKHK
jgi:hypothetical protein